MSRLRSEWDRGLWKGSYLVHDFEVEGVHVRFVSEEETWLEEGGRVLAEGWMRGGVLRARELFDLDRPPEDSELGAWDEGPSLLAKAMGFLSVFALFGFFSWRASDPSSNEVLFEILAIGSLAAFSYWRLRSRERSHARAIELYLEARDENTASARIRDLQKTTVS
ncbi:MAG: hypothetical protein AAGD06_05890 [Acidobacteriota bacterium]